MDVPAVDKPGHGRLRRRRNVLLAIIGLAVIASVGGLLISTTIKSPAQQAAETAAPGLTRLTAPVQYTVIRNTVQANDVITKPPQISSLSSSGGGGGPSGAAPARQLPGCAGPRATRRTAVLYRVHPGLVG